MEELAKNITRDELGEMIVAASTASPDCALAHLLEIRCSRQKTYAECLTKSLIVIAESWEADVSGLKQNLAGLERTCEMDDYKTGEKAEYNECEEHIYHCESCHEERGVYAYNENGDVWAEMPKFCPACGAKVVER